MQQFLLFGLMLLDQVRLKPDMTVLDVGFGTGFPVIELAQPLGNSSTVYGIDPWTAVLERIQNEIKPFNIKTVKLVEGDAWRAKAVFTLILVSISEMVVSGKGLKDQASGSTGRSLPFMTRKSS
ncbi:MAG: methyltransferase domain-containing protein [Candidatus Aminicenantes bacterium]|nr:MAG: methyltransferase domain-containing protein [Candidatus Aminicenantes bacterium]